MINRIPPDWAIIVLIALYLGYLSFIEKGIILAGILGG